MKHTTHRRLIEAAIQILSDGQPRTASGISRAVREDLGIPHRCDRMGELMVAASAEGVVKLAPRLKGCRSQTWVLGDQPLPDWLFVRERPQPEPAHEPEPDDATTAIGLWRGMRDMWLAVNKQLTSIEAKLADLTADRKPRPLFDAVRRNGH